MVVVPYHTIIDKSRDHFTMAYGKTHLISIATFAVGYFFGICHKELGLLEPPAAGISNARIDTAVECNYHCDDSNTFLAHPSKIVPILERRFAWLEEISVSPDPSLTLAERARFAYLELLRTVVSGAAYGKAEKSVRPALGVKQNSVTGFDYSLRQGGQDWTYLGYTMTGFTRLNKLRELWVDVFEKKIPGDFIETGVWRGGSSIYAKGIIDAYGQSHRQVYVCDSFQGLPPGLAVFGQEDVGWDNTPYLEVSEELVKGHFREVNLIDDNVHFVKGFFNDSMPLLRSTLPPGQKFAIMRLDGDMYQSTVDVLYTLYDRLSVGGYLIMDDWFGFPSRTACEDFFRVHNFQPDIIQIDDISAYWKKTQEINIQYWRYEQKKFK